MATRLGTVTIIVALAAALHIVSGADKPPLTQQVAAKIRIYNDAADQVRRELANHLDAAAQAPATTRGDVPLITKHMEGVASAYTSAVEALEKGDEDAAAEFVRKAEDLSGHRERWATRLGYRQRQAQVGEYLPATKDTYDMLVSGHRRREDSREVDAYIEAKKLRSEAFGRLADATTPAAEEDALLKLADEVFDAETDVQVANMKLEWANEDSARRRWTMTDPTITSPELTQALEKLAQWRRESETAFRQSRTAERALERYKRKNIDLSAAVLKAYRAAKAEKVRLTQENKKKDSAQP